MEEPTYEYDWRHPITVPNPNNKSGVSIENGSFEWFKHWLHDNCTYKQIAEHFNTSESAVQNIAKLFKWRERKSNKEDYESRQREALQQERYQQFIDKDYNNAQTQMNALYTLSQIALIFLGVLPDKGQLTIPEDMTIKEATRILQGNPQAINKMHSQILRDLEKAPAINDKQSHTIQADMNLNQSVQVDDTNLIDDLFSNLYTGDDDDGGNTE